MVVGPRPMLAWVSLCIPVIVGATANDTCEPPEAWSRPRRLRLALVRHGESLNNVLEAQGEVTYRNGRLADPDLSPQGFEQANHLGSFLSDSNRAAVLGLHPIDELWVSPVKRTLQTMKPTALALNMAPRVMTQCFEAGGIYDAFENYTKFQGRGGLGRSAMEEMYDGTAGLVLPPEVTEQGWYQGSGRETTAECRARAGGFAREMIDRAAAVASDITIVLVVHYDFMCATLDELVRGSGVVSGQFRNWRHYNTGITVVDIGVDGSVALLTANAHSHLPVDKISGFKPLLDNHKNS